MLIFLAVILVFTLIVVLFLHQEKFGRKPTGKRLERVQQSPFFKNGQFQNISVTPALTEGVSYYAVLKKFFFERNKNGKPHQTLPAVKIDLHQLSPGENVLVWFGHSSYFMQVDGKKFLVDPVLSGAASPIKATTRSFKGADVYAAADIPAIDYLLITHDHWDHLDFDTMIQLKQRVGTIICGLGVGEHFERWGFDMQKIIEKEWDETVVLESGFIIHTTTARHFSGRGLSRNTSLWMSYVLQTPSFNLFIGGDSGYDTHFEKIGNHFGPFDLAILECGQYDKSWRYIHTLPEEILKAAHALRAKKLMPVHWGKFQLGNHDWDEPIKTLTELAAKDGTRLITPMIGQPFDLKDETRVFDQWWTTIN